MDRPVVSIIVPTFNAARSIERALASALAGAPSEAECVVVDDGSTDETPRIVERLAADDPRIVVLHASANEGVSAARNRGLAASRGAWLTFLDADDRLLPGAITTMLDAARGDDALVVGQRVWSNGRLRWQTGRYANSDVRAPGRKSLATHPGLVYYASATGKLFQRSLIDGLEFEGRVLGDQPWAIRAMIRAGDRIRVIDDLVYEWIRPMGRSSATITAAKLASARRGAEAARVAVTALADVTAEAAARVPDPSLRDRIVAGYFERLVSSDLGGSVRRAVSRRDDGTVELFDAIEAFLAAAPRGLVDASPGVAEDLLRPPLDRWLLVREPGRSAYLAFLRRVLVDHPALRGRLAAADLTRPAVWILRRSDGRVARAIAGVLLVLNWPLGVVHRLRRFPRPTILAPWVRPEASRR